jgi:hypothetical protein
MMNESEPLHAARPLARPLALWLPSDLYQMPTDKTEYLVHDLLPAVGTSQVVASPKSGKSCLTRQLCAFVSQGKPFLGREVTQGKTLYVSTQEQPSKIAEHFRALGCDQETMPLVFAGERLDPRDALDRVSATLKGHPELKLCVIDMVADVLPLKDTNDYSEMGQKFGRLQYLVQEHGIHLCVTHHSKKAQTDNPVHSSIGSQAIAGSFDSIVRISVDARGQRSIDTAQRYGTGIDHTLLTWDAEQRAFSIGQGVGEARAEQKEATRERILKEIFTCALNYPGRTRDEILAMVTGNTTALREAFNQVLAEEHLLRSGSGGKGDPYTYKLAEKPTNPAAIAA